MLSLFLFLLLLIIGASLPGVSTERLIHIACIKVVVRGEKEVLFRRVMPVDKPDGRFRQVYYAAVGYGLNAT